ncbi:MAG: LysM peptidoglycan-binding domain-containing M23 family metallopeptidase [Bosea sp.]|nr:LysM peptidoglycan-binding domain-containing M23 family metallopeptidase [Bosea sp. (in: a-proteobacteria)]
MRKSVSPARSRFFVQVAAISLLAGLTAACSGDATRFGIPAFTGSTANQKSIIGGDDQPMPAPVANVSSQPVQSTQMAGSSRQDALLPGVAPAPAPVATAAQPQPLNRPVEPVQTAAATPAATGKPGWNAASGTVVTLGPGETLSSISRRYGVPVKELARANNIADPSAVGIGTRITIPTYGVAGGAAKPAVAVADEKKVAATEPATSLSGLHTVTPGQTVDQIARLYNVSPREIAALNHLGANDALRSGQQIKIPGHSPTSTVALRPEPVRKPEAPKGEDGDAAKSVAQAAPGADAPETTASIAPADKAAADAAAKEMASAAAKPQPTAYAPASGDTATAAVADAPSANGTSFRWPVRGRIIGSFGSGPTGERNDGINLAVPEGTSIKAVEAGTVIYAGNELQGYGQLVLIRHADGWVSAYAHNSAILVQRGDTVRRGQIISRAGTSGNVSAPQLHFELRKGSKPVNPLDYLQG